MKTKAENLLKGQGIIAEILLFGTTMMLSVAMLLLVTMGDDNPVKEDNIQASLEQEAASVEDQALMTYILHQKMDVDINAGQVLDTSIFHNVVSPDYNDDTVCEFWNCEEEINNIGEHLPQDYRLYNAAQDLEDEVDNYHENDPRRIQYNQFANSSHSKYESDITYYGEHSDYHSDRKGGCNFDIDNSENYKDSDYEDGEVCTDFIVSPQQEYNMTVYQTVQEYFTGDEFRMDDQTYNKEGVKIDLQNFLEMQHANDEYLMAEPGRKGILNINSGDEQIEAETENDVDIEDWESYRREIPTTDGNINFILWVGRP